MSQRKNCDSIWSVTDPPDYDDIVGSFADEYSANPEPFDEALDEYNFKHDSSYCIDSCPDSVKDHLMQSVIYTDDEMQFRAQCYWDDEVEYLNVLLKGYDMDQSYLTFISSDYPDGVAFKCYKSIDVIQALLKYCGENSYSNTITLYAISRKHHLYGCCNRVEFECIPTEWCDVCQEPIVKRTLTRAIGPVNLRHLCGNPSCDEYMRE